MDFRSRGTGSPSPITSTGSNSTSSSSSANNKQGISKWMERGSMVLLIGVAILIAAIAGLTFLGGNGQSKAVIKDKYQAVFLNNGQVYFGNIKELNKQYISLQNIYYLQTNNSDSSQNNAAASGNVSLVKLGCELHSPFDQMLINSDQVIFWENLQDSGQVVKAIAQYKKDNPKGQTCSTSSSNSTQQAPSTSTQSTTPTTSTPTTTKKP